MSGWQLVWAASAATRGTRDLMATPAANGAKDMAPAATRAGDIKHQSTGAKLADRPVGSAGKLSPRSAHSPSRAGLQLSRKGESLLLQTATISTSALISHTIPPGQAMLSARDQLFSGSRARHRLSYRAESRRCSSNRAPIARSHCRRLFAHSDRLETSHAHRGRH